MLSVSKPGGASIEYRFIAPHYVHFHCASSTLHSVSSTVWQIFTVLPKHAAVKAAPGPCSADLHELSVGGPTSWGVPSAAGAPWGQLGFDALMRKLSRSHPEAVQQRRRRVCHPISLTVTLLSWTWSLVRLPSTPEPCSSSGDDAFVSMHIRREPHTVRGLEGGCYHSSGKMLGCVVNSSGTTVANDCCLVWKHLQTGYPESITWQIPGK